eukprot:GFKZ01008258.1.p1 GENE.GFKZ01008258.1~~GFKZ01008258.1.p1  ORF type:complete len:395 (-),score=55.84 GFKZ01008258.1:616-1650(-)
MKAQHQIKFKRRRPRYPRGKPKKNADLQPGNTNDITAGHVIVGDRQLHFARALSDTEKAVRDSSLSSLQAWLKENGPALSAGEIDRLWKALFYCVWMADKRPVITATISAVAELRHLVGWKFLEGGFRCIVREWNGVDRHRVDKYYELVNRMLESGTRDICAANDDDGFLQGFAEWEALLQKTVWDQLPRQGLGVALHILDVYVDRVMRPVMKRAATLSGNQVHKVFDELMKDLYRSMGNSDGHAYAIGRRTRERVFERLVDLVEQKEMGLKRKDQRDLIRRTAKRLFSIAAAKETPQELRKDLYDLQVELRVFVEKVDASGEGRGDGDREVPGKNDTDNGPSG